MSSSLNPPDRILQNLKTAPARMEAVDALLLDQTRDLFARSVSRILGHMEVNRGHVSYSLDGSAPAELCFLLVSAAAEFETGWNNLRLANVPASRRQGRVAAELVALAVLISLPSETLLALPRKLTLVRTLLKYPGKTLAELYRPTLDATGRKAQIIDPPIKGSVIFPAFLRVCRDHLGLPAHAVENLQQYREKVQHPSSHASVDVWVFHFEGFEQSGNRAGAWLSKDRTWTYRQASEDLANQADWMAEILDRTAAMLENRG